MDTFRGIVPFVAVAETRSFRRAAERMGVTAAAVSKAVLALEAETRSTLFLRTSRRVELTEEGRRFYDRCKEALALVNSGREALSASRKLPTGRLTVSSSFVVARLVSRAITEWKANYADVTIELRASDRLVRFASENVDVGIRVGGPGDDTVVVHELRKTRWVTVASPSYLARKGTPRSVNDLARHECVRFVLPRGATRDWSFAEPGDPARVETHAVAGRLDVDHGELLLEAVEAGAGVCQVLDFMARDALFAGRLVEVLADQRAEGPPVYAVHLPEKRALARVRTFLDQLRASFAASVQPA